jgi:KaiC/GvpD/RAD55 family RecA-like ATPase
MTRIPFGVRRLDQIINGGAPPGSVVLLSGEAGAGAREFMYTSAAMNGLALADEEMFDLYYGNLPADSSPPDEVHYLSFTDEQEKLRRDMAMAMDEELVETALEAIEFHDLSEPYYRLSLVPREWYTNASVEIGDLGADNDRRSVPEALGERLSANAPGSLMVIDSLTDLVTTTEGFDWPDVSVLLRGLSRVAYGWGGLVLVLANRQTLSDSEHGQLVDAVDGTMQFSWEAGGSSLARVMVVRQFRGVLSRLEAESIVRFETEISDTGFDISDVRKIR